MKKSPSEMTNAELRQYLSEHRNEEAEIEMIFKEKLNQIIEE